MHTATNLGNRAVPTRAPTWLPLTSEYLPVSSIAAGADPKGMFSNHSLIHAQVFGLLPSVSEKQARFLPVSTKHSNARARGAVLQPTYRRLKAERNVKEGPIGEHLKGWRKNRGSHQRDAIPGDNARQTKPFASSRCRPPSTDYAAHPGRRKEHIPVPTALCLAPSPPFDLTRIRP